MPSGSSTKVRLPSSWKQRSGTPGGILLKSVADRCPGDPSVRRVRHVEVLAVQPSGVLPVGAVAQPQAAVPADADAVQDLRVGEVRHLNRDRGPGTAPVSAPVEGAGLGVEPDGPVRVPGNAHHRPLQNAGRDYFNFAVEDDGNRAVHLSSTFL